MFWLQVMDRSGEPTLQQLWAPNVLGVFQLIRELAPHMKQGPRALGCNGCNAVLALFCCPDLTSQRCHHLMVLLRCSVQTATS